MSKPRLYLIPSRAFAAVRGEKAISFFERGLAECARGYWQAARSLFSRSLRSGPADIATLNNLAVCHAACDSDIEAIALFHWADVLDLYSGPAGGTALANRAMLASRMGRAEKAVEYAEAALSLNPGIASRQAARVTYMASGKLALAERYADACS